MSYVTYIAQREIRLGHVVGTSYIIEFAAQGLDRSGKVEKSVSTSLGGQSEAIRIRRDIFWNVKSDIIPESLMNDWREFLASTDANESFTFDAYGTSVPTSPAYDLLDEDGTAILDEDLTAILDEGADNPLSVERTDDTDQESRIHASLNYTVDFKARVL
jgi:hypothetical protein